MILIIRMARWSTTHCYSGVSGTTGFGGTGSGGGVGGTGIGSQAPILWDMSRGKIGVFPS
jgi:hypothetical protein